MNASELHSEISSWMRTFDVIPSDWEEVIWEYLNEEYSEEVADSFTEQVMELFGVQKKSDKSVQEWLSECPTSWNMEYHKDFGKMCYFIREKNEDEKTFMEVFNAWPIDSQ